jgi:flagellum-specific peptidoglycan hydrolase FlgJ
MTQPSPVAVAAARAAMAAWKIPASVSLAQFILESGWGAHMPPGSNNPFGIKALPGQPSVTVPTREFVGGRYVVINAPFRAFASLDEAFDEHARLLATAGCYAPARAKLPDVAAFCAALTGVYATDPHYGASLIAVIQGSDLTQYDAPVTA